MLEDAYSAINYLNQIENGNFTIDVEKAYIINEYRFLLKTYKAEALILQQKYKDARAIYKSLSNAGDSPIFAETIHSLNVPEVCSKKTLAAQNVVSLDLILGNLEEAKAQLDILTNEAGCTNEVGSSNGKEIPSGLLMCWIYFYIRTGEKEMALELIKRRRFLSPMINEKGSLLKITH